MYGRKARFAIVLCLALRVVSPAHATVSFRPPVSYPVGVAPTAVVAADFNADGNPDLAVANSKSADLSILLGDGDGTFREAVNVDAGMPNPQTLVAGDFNKDGKMDLAVLQPGMLSVLLGMGDGSFQSPKTLAVATSSSFMVAADFNVDKTLDMAVSNFDPNTGAASIDIFLGNGDGSFQPAKQVSILSGGPLSSATFAVRDVDGDGKPDLVVSGYKSIDIFLGNGDGTFRQGTSIDVPDGRLTNSIYPIGTLYLSFSITDLRTADVNGDGRTDLVVFLDGVGKICQGGACMGTKDRSEVVSVYLGNGNGSFQSQQIISSAVRLLGNDRQIHGPQLIGMLLGDFDGDGTIDVADRRCSGSCGLEILLGLGNGTFTPAVTLTDAGPLQLAADLNGDQVTDLVVLDKNANAIDILVNTSPSFSMTASTLALTVSPGQQVTDTLTFAGHNGFSSAIHLSCQVAGPAPLPACSLSTPDVTGGSDPTTSLLTISAPANSAAPVSSRIGSLFRLVYALAFPFALLAIGHPPKRPVSASRRWLQVMTLATIALVCVACGSGGNVKDPPHSKSYVVTTTAASSTIKKTLQISLTTP